MKSGAWTRSLMAGLAGLMLVMLVACGGGGSSDNTAGSGGSASSPMGTLSLSLTDSPACGYDNVWITVQKVRVHRSSSAADDDAGWIDIPLPAAQPSAVPLPLRVDLLTLTNGVLVPLGRVQLPAGTYTQLRLVLAPNTAGEPYANAVTPTGASMVALTTPSAQQSGLKMNVQLNVPAGQEADFAIDFDACKSIVKAGKSGKILLKPVLSVLPILSAAGQRIQGWLDPSLAADGTTVSVQAAGQVVRATPPLRDAGGNLGFVLYPVPLGSFDLVVTAPGRATAIVTGVPSYAGASTTVNSVAMPIVPPATMLQSVSGSVTVGASPIDTGGLVRALQSLAGGPTVEVASVNAAPDDGSYAMALPLAAPAKAAYVSGTMPQVFVPDAGAQGGYLLSATTTRSSQVLTAPIVVDSGPVVQDFAFAAAP
jgi:hypothetical protein